MDIIIEKRNITPEKAIAMLKAQGISINIEEATEGVDFLYFLALLFYKQYAGQL